MGALAPLGVLSRRRALKGAAALLALGAGSAGGLVALRGRAPDVPGLRFLTAHEHRTLTALAVALFPEGGAFPLGAASLDLGRTFDGYAADEPPDVQDDLRKALTLFEYGPLVYERRLVTFSNLPADARLATFDRWQASDDPVRRQIALAFRKLLAISFYDHPEAWPHIGYPGPA